ncbi:WD40 repeat domain-containing protein [Deltaproteobacteria bacterium TL4]
MKWYLPGLMIFWMGLMVTQGRCADDEYLLSHTFKLGEKTVYDSIFSADSRTLVTLAKSHHIEVWYLQNSNRLRSISTGKHSAISMVYHPRQPLIITGGKDNNIQIWDVNQAQSKGILRGHIGNVNTLAVDLKGELLVSGSHIGNLIVWDLGKKARHLKLSNAHQGAIFSVAIHPNGQVFASAGKDKKIKIWQLPSGKLLQTLNKHTQDVNQIRFHPEGKWLGSASNDKTLILWDWESGQAKQELVGHKKAVTSFDFHPNGPYLISAGLDSEAILWELPAGKIVNKLKPMDSPAMRLQFDGKGERLSAAFDNGVAQVWTLGKSSFFASLTGHTRTITSLDFTPNGKYLLSASMDQSLKIWDLSNQKLMRTYSTQSHRVQDVRFSKDSKLFVTAGADSTIGIWNTQSGDRTGSLLKHRGKVNTLSFHPSDPVLVSGGSDQKWILWDLTKKIPLLEQSAHDDQINAVRFSRDGQFFATGSGDKTIKLWSYPQGELLTTLKSHKKAVLDLEFSPVEALLASASQDKTIKLWEVSDPKKAKLKHTLKGHQFIVNRVLFSKDGRTLISISKDKTVRLWEVKSGDQIRILSGENNPLVSGSISPDGKLIAVGSLANEIIIFSYPLSIAEFKTGTRVKNAAGRPGSAGLETESSGAKSQGSPLKDKEVLDTADLENEDDEKAREAEELKVFALSEKGNSSEIEQAERNQYLLNRLLAERQTCKNYRAINELVLQILRILPNDQAAYHALLKTSLLQGDLKMVYLMASLGQKAQFYTNRYTYANPLDVSNVFHSWLTQIFDQSHQRQGEQISLTLRDCQGKVIDLEVPLLTTQLGLSKEFVEQVTSIAFFIDIRDFQNIHEIEFKNRIFAELLRAVTTKTPYPKTRIPLSPSTRAPEIKTGILHVNLERLQSWGHPGKVEFQLRESGEPWQTYITDQDKIAIISLHSGKYYLSAENNIRRAFILQPEQTIKMKIE